MNLMGQVINNTLELWQEEGRQLIPQHFEKFRNLVSQAKHFEERGDYNTAAIYGDIAADYAAFSQHCGLFFSPDLEYLLLRIGRKAIQSSLSWQNNSSPRTPKKILHVVHGVWNTGGHSRLLWRWIQQDVDRSHSVVLTRMSVSDTPQVLKDSVSKSHGKIYALSETVGNFIARAKRLRKIAESADIVVLHTVKDGSITDIAFAQKDQSPPIIYVNHADERFWPGVGIIDVVANLRESGMRLSQNRRGIDAIRNMLLPTLIEPAQRKLSRAEAKRQLGIDENSVMLLSIARAVKYESSDTMTFADAHVPLLEQHEQAMLVVVGPGNHEDWSVAIQKTQGRIRVLGETPDTALFYQAADIYVDSYPFVSITSLLEAGSYGTPLVSRYPYSSDACEIFGADMPGLTGNLIRVRDLEEYTKVLSQLVENKEFRLSLGEVTKQGIEKTHTGSNWQRSLEDVYARAETLPRITLTSDSEDLMSIDEPDIFLQKVFHFENPSIDQMILNRVRLMSLSKRLSLFSRLIETGNFGRMGPISLFLPDWFYRRLGGLKNI
jgi:glycosyltransferase involved in cell wall biosynthesis